MIGLALMLAAVQQPDVAVSNDDIVVIAQRLQSWRGNWRSRKGAVTCKTARSTGDKAIDAIGCTALVECVKPNLSRFEAAVDKRRPADERAQVERAVLRDSGTCLAERRKVMIADLAASRRAVRQKK